MQNCLFETEKPPKKNVKNTSKKSVEKSFEEHVQALEQAIEHLNAPDLSLKEGIEWYKMGMQELLLAQKLLTDAHLEYEKLQTLD
ncbi:exodeoxyribonuclease VII small subunit [Helicobacter cetorum]|uniref:Exodeoxyribonuclease VII small subunit n=1 Tax=Helicobacter cetorum (strain ATCC BAA-540 / CCUG 52418 / MIT 99-5656) TaxID=1163745 RepID=I0ESG5_HELCM|nr:exodeoxyribonuclease VII small subunit [Helicobacter cetorum]AFI05884.1 exodeoxyribonuclease VII small subunit [Helicobacter cetorum MIT 99-5656]